VQQPTTPLFTLAQQSHQVVHETPISFQDLDLMFYYIMHVPQIFQEARGHLRAEYFDHGELSYALFWSVVCDLSDHYRQFDFHMVTNELNRRLSTNPIVTEELRDALTRPDITGIVFGAMCTVPGEPPCTEHALDLLRRFLHERTVVRPVTRLLSQGRNGNYPRDVMQFLEAATTQARRLDGMRDIPVGGAMPEIGSPLAPPSIYIPTGLSFIDPYIKGQRPGDCNGILGCYGSGKTTLGVQLTMENAQNSWHNHLTTGEPPKLSIFMSYEEPQSKVERRLWSYAARIRRDKLESMKSWSELTTPDNLEDYERTLSGAGSAGIIYSESERWDQARTWYNKTFRLFDMSGSEDFPAVGSGYVQEAAALISRVRELTGMEIGTVTIDYAGLMARRYMQANNINEEKMRYFLAGLGDMLRREIAEKNQCTVWLLHQFNGDQNKRSSTTLLHHSDAAEAKAFAENLAVCACLGTEDKLTGCRLLNFSKVRYYNDRSQSAPTLQIDGRFGCMIDVSHRFIVNPDTRSFMDPNTRNALEGQVSDRPQYGPVGHTARGTVGGVNLGLGRS
jgi:hypothetical protein